MDRPLVFEEDEIENEEAATAATTTATTIKNEVEEENEKEKENASGIIRKNGLHLAIPEKNGGEMLSAATEGGGGSFKRFHRHSSGGGNSNNSHRASIASTIKTIKKIANYPEFVEGGDEYVFDKNQQIWRSRPAPKPLIPETPMSLTLPPTQKKHSVVASFFLSKAPFNRAKAKSNETNSAILDWILLASLGTMMALLSFALDHGIHTLQHSRDRILHALEGWKDAQFAAWTLFAVVLVAAAAVYCRWFGPQAIGSGIPEMKTSIRGVMLKEYLTIRTFFAKVIGLTLSLGSGAPIGKEGPFVHIGSIMAHQLARLARNVAGAYSNESRRTEMLAAGCAVGVACTFSSPVGGVLYSIEATSVYFGMHNYKRCFLAATFSSTVFRCLQVFAGTSTTVVALYQTNFPKRCFSIDQLPLFGILGLICGLVAAFYVCIQRQTMYFIKNKYMRIITQKYWLMYPILVMFAYGAITFPGGVGGYLAGERLFGETVRDFFGNCSWVLSNTSEPFGCTQAQLGVWSNNGKSLPMNVLMLFFAFSFIFITLCSTLPVPLGAFVPSFVIGGSIGRAFGEVLLILMPHRAATIFPGIYAVVGAAAFCSGATHSVSVAVILYEVTGQLHFTIPILIGVIVAHAVGKHLQPSMYDSIVQIKKLPYLPDISHISQDFIGITAEQFMVKDVKFLSHDSTLADVREILIKFPGVHTFPICDSHKNQILIGSCRRTNLRKIIDRIIGPKAYSAELARRLTNMNPDGTNISQHSAPSATDLDTVNSDPNPSNNNSKWEKDSLLSKEQPLTITSGWKLRSFIHRKKNLDNGVFGFNSKERAQWEAAALEAHLELNEIEFDSAPFQLMDRSPLLHVHMLFSLLGLKRAYITKCGRLEGLISRRQLRKGIEDVRQGLLVARRTSGKLDPSLLNASMKPEIQFKN